MVRRVGGVVGMGPGGDSVLVVTKRGGGESKRAAPTKKSAKCAV